MVTSALVAVVAMGVWISRSPDPACRRERRPGLLHSLGRTMPWQ